MPWPEHDPFAPRRDRDYERPADSLAHRRPSGDAVDQALQEVMGQSGKPRKWQIIDGPDGEPHQVEITEWPPLP